MRRLVSVVLIFFLLTGCSQQQPPDRALMLRQRLLKSGCSFDAEVTADYGSTVYVFQMHCQGKPDGSLDFRVTEPESIRDITGTCSAEGGRLTYDGTLLAFSALAEGQLTPVSGPWVLFSALRGGCLTSWGTEKGKTLLCVDDSYQKDPLHLEVRLDGRDAPESCEILWRNRRILTLRLNNFRFAEHTAGESTDASV